MTSMPNGISWGQRDWNRMQNEICRSYVIKIGILDKFKIKRNEDKAGNSFQVR